jgi:hypothetical protein
MMPSSERVHCRVNDAPDPHRVQQAVDRVFPEREMARAIRTLTSWPGYAETPLIDLPDLGQRLGGARIGYMRIGEEAAARAMRLLAEGSACRAPVMSGETGAAGLAALVAAAGEPELASSLGLTPESRVLLFGSEAALDPALFRSIVGRYPDPTVA